MRSALTPHRLLIAAAVLYVVTQFVVVTPRIYLGWDEVVYLSQFAPGVPPISMSAPRAFGTALLVAPVAAVTGSVGAVRIYLMLLSGLGVYLAYRPWLRVRSLQGWTVPLAAVLFCGLWPSIFYGNEAMPNVASACCAVAAVGCFLTADTWRFRFGLVASLGLMGLIRPLDALWVATPLAAIALARRGCWARLPVAIAAGLAIGWVPWIIESYVRFGGIVERYRLIDAENGNGLHAVLLRQLASFSTGTIQCMPTAATCGRIGFAGVFAWLMIVVLTAAALRRAQLRVAVGTAVAFALPYLFLTGIANPRFLLPAYGLLMPAVAETLLSLCRRPIGLIAAMAISGIFLGGQLGTVTTVADTHYQARLRQTHVAGRLRAIGVRPPCLVYGRAAAAIGYATKCTAWPTMNGLPARPPAALLHRAAAGIQVVALDVRPAEHGWQPGFQYVRMLAHRHWFGYVSLPGRPLP